MTSGASWINSPNLDQTENVKHTEETRIVEATTQKGNQPEPFNFADDLKILPIERSAADLQSIEKCVEENKANLAIEKRSKLALRDGKEELLLKGKILISDEVQYLLVQYLLHRYKLLHLLVPEEVTNSWFALLWA